MRRDLQLAAGDHFGNDLFHSACNPLLAMLISNLRAAGVSYNPLYREGISKDRLSALRAQYPDIYDEFVDQTESRIFKVVKSAIA